MLKLSALLASVVILATAVNAGGLREPVSAEAPEAPHCAVSIETDICEMPLQMADLDRLELQDLALSIQATDKLTAELAQSIGDCSTCSKFR